MRTRVIPRPVDGCSSMNLRLYPAMLSLVLVLLPALAYLFASRTAIGSVVLILPWSNDEGIHTSDVMLCSMLAPVWLGTAWRLVRSRHHSASR